MDCGCDPRNEKEFDDWCTHEREKHQVEQIEKLVKENQILWEQNRKMKYLQESYNIIGNQLIELRKAIDDLQIDVAKLKQGKDVVHFGEIV